MQHPRIYPDYTGSTCLFTKHGSCEFKLVDIYLPGLSEFGIPTSPTKWLGAMCKDCGLTYQLTHTFCWNPTRNLNSAVLLHATSTFHVNDLNRSWIVDHQDHRDVNQTANQTANMDKLDELHYCSFFRKDISPGNQSIESSNYVGVRCTECRNFYPLHIAQWHLFAHLPDSNMSLQSISKIFDYFEASSNLDYYTESKAATCIQRKWRLCRCGPTLSALSALPTLPTTCRHDSENVENVITTSREAWASQVLAAFTRRVRSALAWKTTQRKLNSLIQHKACVRQSHQLTFQAATRIETWIRTIQTQQMYFWKIRAQQVIARAWDIHKVHIAHQAATRIETWIRTIQTQRAHQLHLRKIRAQQAIARVWNIHKAQIKAQRQLRKKQKARRAKLRRKARKQAQNQALTTQDKPQDTLAASSSDTLDELTLDEMQILAFELAPTQIQFLSAVVATLTDRLVANVDLSVHTQAFLYTLYARIPDCIASYMEGLTFTAPPFQTTGINIARVQAQLADFRTISKSKLALDGRPVYLVECQFELHEFPEVVHRCFLPTDLYVAMTKCGKPSFDRAFACFLLAVDQVYLTASLTQVHKSIQSVDIESVQLVYYSDRQEVYPRGSTYYPTVVSHMYTDVEKEHSANQLANQMKLKHIQLLDKLHPSTNKVILPKLFIAHTARLVGVQRVDSIYYSIRFAITLANVVYILISDFDQGYEHPVRGPGKRLRAVVKNKPHWQKDPMESWNAFVDVEAASMGLSETGEAKSHLMKRAKTMLANVPIPDFPKMVKPVGHEFAKLVYTDPTKIIAMMNTSFTKLAARLRIGTVIRGHDMRAPFSADVITVSQIFDLCRIAAMDFFDHVVGKSYTKSFVAILVTLQRHIGFILDPVTDTPHVMNHPAPHPSIQRILDSWNTKYSKLVRIGEHFRTYVDQAPRTKQWMLDLQLKTRPDQTTELSAEEQNQLRKLDRQSSFVLNTLGKLLSKQTTFDTAQEGLNFVLCMSTICLDRPECGRCIYAQCVKHIFPLHSDTPIRWFLAGLLGGQEGVNQSCYTLGQTCNEIVGSLILL